MSLDRVLDLISRLRGEVPVVDRFIERNRLYLHRLHTLGVSVTERGGSYEVAIGSDIRFLIHRDTINPKYFATMLTGIDNDPTRVEHEKRLIVALLPILYAYPMEYVGYLRHYAPKEGDVVLDAGSTWGDFALPISRLVGAEGRVVAMEPSEELYGVLLKNIGLNGFKNIIPLKLGLSSKKGTAGFAHDGTVRGAISSTEATGTLIRTTSIDEIVGDLGLGRMDFIKMDIEGEELNAIRGASKTIERFRPSFAIASYHIKDSVQTRPRLEEMLKAHGYRTVTEYPHQTTYAL